MCMYMYEHMSVSVYMCMCVCMSVYVWWTCMYVCVIWDTDSTTDMELRTRNQLKQSQRQEILTSFENGLEDFCNSEINKNIMWLRENINAAIKHGRYIDESLEV